MAVPFVKVFYTPVGGAQQDITEFTNVQNKRGLQIKDAKCDLSINNSKYRYKNSGESIFTENGTVEVFADYAPITQVTNQHILTGEIQEITHGFAEGGSQTKLSVSDKTNLLLSSLWGFTYSNTSVDAIIRSVIQNAPSAFNEITTNNVVTTTTSGAAFPSINMAKTMKPIYEWLTDLSQPETTGEDKAYLFYVDKDNDLHWFYPAATVSASIIEGSTTDIYSAQFKKSQDALVNMLIYNAGQDLKGNGNLYYSYDTQSKSNKLRMKFQPMIDIGRDMFLAELTGGNIVESTGQNLHYQGKDYKAVSYPLTPKWENAASVADETAYNNAFRARQRVVAERKSQSIMQAFAGLRWKGSLQIKGTSDYVAGTLIYTHFPTTGLITQSLRVWDVAHSFGTDGWITTLELREDDGAIS